MLLSAICEPPELIRGDYSIYNYGYDLVKVVRFKSRVIPMGRHTRSLSAEPYDHRLDASISRSRRRLLELALCNPWDWFCTFTLSDDKVGDRFDLKAFHGRFSQWLRDQRKKGYELSFVIVPERHESGAWHAHGLFRGNMELVSFADEAAEGLRVPLDLIDRDYYDWPAYREKFGFCSFGLLKNPLAAGFYVTKYLTKDSCRMVDQAGLHLYWPSKPLNHAVKRGEVFGSMPALDACLRNHYEFCSTGMVVLNTQNGGDLLLDEIDARIEETASEFVSFDNIPMQLDDEFKKMDAALQLMIDDYNGGAHPW